MGFQDLSANHVQSVNTNITLDLVFVNLVQTNLKIRFTTVLPKSHQCVNFNVQLDLNQSKYTQSVNQKSTYKLGESEVYVEYLLSSPRSFS